MGHGIIDIDTGDLINISSGELVTSRLVSIVKGEKGIPGEIKGTIVGRRNNWKYKSEYKFWYIW